MEHKTPLPLQFIERVKQDAFLGEELLTALESKSPTAIRIHPLKGKHPYEDLTPIPWSENGRWLKERPVFTLDPLFHAGCYYPQEAGSQLLSFVLKALELPKQPVCLDLCAAPGGKSSLILDHLKGTGLLVSNEIVTTRARILYETLTKWGYDNSVVTNNAPDAIGKLSNFFDLILVDAPCSGEGMFRKDLDSRNEWSESNVTMCADRQKDIVSAVWSSLKENGYLVYSTCTFNEDENEKNVEWICDAFNAEVVPIDYPSHFTSRNGLGAYALPNRVNTEGFYICVLQKKEETRSKKVKLKALKEVQGEKALHDFVKPTEQMKLVDWREKAWLIPKALEEEISLLSQTLNVFKLCLPVGEPTRKGWNPDEAVVFSQHLSTQLRRINVDKQHALKYLKGETFPIETGNGFAVICFEDIPLGWIKLIGNRFNNNYPKEWRIRMKID